MPAGRNGSALAFYRNPETFQGTGRSEQFPFCSRAFSVVTVFKSLVHNSSEPEISRSMHLIPGAGEAEAGGLLELGALSFPPGSSTVRGAEACM